MDATEAGALEADSPEPERFPTGSKQRVAAYRAEDRLVRQEFTKLTQAERRWLLGESCTVADWLHLLYEMRAVGDALERYRLDQPFDYASLGPPDWASGPEREPTRREREAEAKFDELISEEQRIVEKVRREWEVRSPRTGTHSGPIGPSPSQMLASGGTGKFGGEAAPPDGSSVTRPTPLVNVYHKNSLLIEVVREPGRLKPAVALKDGTVSVRIGGSHPATYVAGKVGIATGAKPYEIVRAVELAVRVHVGEISPEDAARQILRSNGGLSAGEGDSL